jgi:hypothetical protein
MKQTLLLPVAAVVVATGWLGFRLLARPSSSASAEVAGAPGARQAPRHRPTRAHVQRKGETTVARPEKPAAAVAPRPMGAAAALPEGEVPRLPSGEVRPLTVVHASPEEMAVHRTLTPIVGKHKDAQVNFITCDAAKPPAGDEEVTPLTAAPRDPGQNVCFARVQAREPDQMRQILREASEKYRGHVAVEWREHLDAYTGHWWEAEIRTDTDDAIPLPNMETIAAAPPPPPEQL